MQRCIIMDDSYTYLIEDLEMTVKKTGFTLRDALEAKTRRLRNKLESLVAEEYEVNSDADRLLREFNESLTTKPSDLEVLKHLQKYANAKPASTLYDEMTKRLTVNDGQVAILPRTRLGAEALRELDIDLDTVNYAFDRAMKQSHG